MRVAVEALRKLKVGRVVVGTPTAALDTAEEMRREVDEFVAVMTPRDFAGVGLWYEDFSQTTDQEVRELLKKGSRPLGAAGP
jgi:predicted phosphoribosyltransferase